MASAMHTAGEERLDMLMAMVPVSYPGSDLVVKALSSLTAVLMSEPQNCERVGVSDVVRYKLEEIRSVRQSREDIDHVDVGIMFDFYYDVLRCYAGAERRQLTEAGFKAMKNFSPGVVVRGVVDGEFPKFHAALATLGFSYFPLDWECAEYIQFREISKSEAKNMQNYCYLRLFKDAYSALVASILGPRPTLGAVLSLLSPRAIKETEEIEGMFVVRQSNNNDLHITRRSPTGAHIFVSDILAFRDDEDGRESGLISIFDRVGASSVDESHDAMFERALNCLNEIVDNCHDSEEQAPGNYRLADVDFGCNSTSRDFPQGPASLRLIYNEGYLPSFLNTWKGHVRAEALSIALREYDKKLLNLHVTSIGLSQLRSQGKLSSCNKRWRSDVANVIGISKTDADYWREVSDEIAAGFRRIYNSPIPNWLQGEFERKVDEFMNEALSSYVKPAIRPASSLFSESFIAEFGTRHSRRVSASSSTSSSSDSSSNSRSAGNWERRNSSGAIDQHKFKLSPQHQERYNYLMNCPERMIPGYVASLPAVQLFRLAGDACYKKYKAKYVRDLVIKESKN